MNPDETILAALTRHAVPFVVIGGLAVIEHGYVQATEDTDLVFRRSAATETTLLAARGAVRVAALAAADEGSGRTPQRLVMTWRT